MSFLCLFYKLILYSPATRLRLKAGGPTLTSQLMRRVCSMVPCIPARDQDRTMY